MVLCWSNKRNGLEIICHDNASLFDVENRTGRKEGHGWSFPITRLTIQVRKVRGGVVGWWPVGL